jgi:hypothetical protein
MNLVRKILMAIEDHPHGRAPDRIEIEGFTEAQINYHVYIMIEGGLVEGSDITHMGSEGYEAMASRLTWAGHEFLDAARDEGRWQGALRIAKEKAGTVTIGIMTQLLSSLMKQSLGLPN